MTMLYSKPKRLSAWQRYAIFVGCMALVYGMGVMALRAAIMPVLQESPGRINSKAPSLQFGIGGPKQSTRHMQSPARHKPWVEIVSGASADEPRIFIVHNLLSDAECDHLISLALKKGLKSSLITPYGSHDLVESTTRTNKQAWLEYGEDDIVKGIEERIAKLTKTYPEQGENLQVLHYDKGQQFTEHHDYFDPATDPPENYEKGGNRLLTLIMYLEAAQEGGETEFFDINRKVVLARGDAVMFYNLKHGCDGINPTCVDSVPSPKSSLLFGPPSLPCACLPRPNHVLAGCGCARKRDRGVTVSVYHVTA